MSPRPFLLLLLLAPAWPAGLAAAAPAAPKPTATRPAPPRRPPLDFSGIWELDPTASRGAPSSMLGAVLSVTQIGHRILIEPVQGGPALLTADQIIADGRTYEKAIGKNAKGYVTANWSPDLRSLRLEVTAGPRENPRESIQRSIWTLSKDRKVWVRQSVTAQKGKSSSVRLVFRKRPKK